MSIEIDFVFPKAYAELEKDTPGQIFGVTFKSDGKSSSSAKSSEPISEKLTQRPTNEDTFYEEHDTKDTNDHRKNQLDYRTYFIFGFFGVFVISWMLMTKKAPEILEYERDRTIAEQQLRQQNQEKNPFDEA